MDKISSPDRRRHRRWSPALRIILAITAACLSSCATEQVESLPGIDGGREIVLPGVLSLSALAVHDGRVYALDRQERVVSVFSEQGRLLTTMGAAGVGPGEFRSPASISVRGSRVLVGERSGRISVFDTSGVFEYAFLASGVLHINSNMIWSDSATVFLGGLRERAGDIYGGSLGHLYDLDGSLRTDFLELAPAAREFETTLRVGGNCSAAADGSLWCVQSMEYRIRHFDAGGTEIASIGTGPGYFSPLSEVQPEEIQSDAGLEWMNGWDLVAGIHLVGERVAVVEVFTPAGKGVLDLWDLENGRLLGSYLSPGRILFADRTSGEVYIALPATEALESRVLVVSRQELGADR